MESNVSCIVCNQPADLKCAGCKSVSYCGKDHQKEHWKKHKDACKPYKVISNSKLGRHLVASRDLNPGDIIVSELPLAVGPKTHQDDDLFSGVGPCVGCYRPININHGERCPKCEWPVCTAHCPGLADPLHHGAECVVLRLGAGPDLTKLGNRYYRYSALVLLRCLVMQRKFPKKWQQLNEMESHMDHRKEGTEAYRETEDQIRYLQENYFKVMDLMEDQTGMKVLENISPTLLHRISGILDVNALDIQLNTGIELTAMYPTVYLMEHNCIPNTTHLFDTTSTDAQKRFKITVKAVRPIKKGENITTMYTHALWGTQARQDHLKTTKYFSCRCARCEDPTEFGTYLSALKCFGTELKPCGGIQLPLDPINPETEWACDKCPVKLKNSEVTQIVLQMGEDVDTVLAKKPNVRDLEELLDKMSLFLHKNHYHIYEIKHSLIQLYGYQQGYLPNQLSDDLLNRKITMCRDLLSVTDKVDPYNARLQLYSGVLVHELHLALVQLGKRKIDLNEDGKVKAIEYLKEAQNLIIKCKDILENEVLNSNNAGVKLHQLALQSASKFKRWLSEKRVILED